jgi:hypothetical protein
MAVDWSGAKSAAERKIWLAEVRKGQVVRLENGRSREGVISFLEVEAGRDPHLVIGLDFAFSCPAWFLQFQGVSSAPCFWELAARKGEQWLARCRPPFWGKEGSRRPTGQENFRRTEQELRQKSGGKAQPKSVFQIGGAGSVGTGSIRGMPFLRRLRAAGFSIWPFDAPSEPTVLEIFPRLFIGSLRKTDPAMRAGFLRGKFPFLRSEILQLAQGSDDAFDAVVSALTMDFFKEELAKLSGAPDDLERLEGTIWAPPPGLFSRDLWLKKM